MSGRQHLLPGVIVGGGRHRVAVWEVSEAFSTRVASRPREVWSAVAAAGQVLTRPVCEV